LTNKSYHIIYKYELPDIINKTFSIDIPIGRIIHIDAQNEKIIIWVMHTTDNLDKNYERKFYIAATGDPINIDGMYSHLSTVMDFVGCVWHVFEVLKENHNDK